ncbi:MAG: chromate efflux transporter [Phyllobacterium sp.]
MAIDHSGTDRLGEVFTVFLKLGLTSFGGPIAHLGYFRDEFVVRRKWLSEAAFADIIALCQFLPGPASSQAGFVLGLTRAGGLSGGIAAWIAFTLPSALLMLLFAYVSTSLAGPGAQGIIHGLKLVAVAVVAQAIWGMAATLTPDRTRMGIALAALAAATFAGSAAGQIIAIAGGATLGLMLCRSGTASLSPPLETGTGRRGAVTALVLFAVLFALPPLLHGLHSQGLRLFEAFYRSGALVFGGGHVVLPLLETALVEPGWVDRGAFLSGYGAAQALPGPLFALSAYLGAIALPSFNGLAGALIALIAIFLPGLLLVYGMLPLWTGWRQGAAAQAAMKGANAAVVGILAAAFYDPVWTGGVATPLDFLLAATGFLLLAVWKIPSWIVVIALAAAGWAML